MSNLTSLRATLRLELHQNSGFVDAAIADSLRFVRGEELHFNAGQHTFSTEADRSIYPLPSDYLGMRGSVFCTPSNSEETSRYALEPRSLDEVERNRYSQDDWDAGIVSGYPKIYAIDYPGKQFIISPQPSTGGDKIFFRYTKDLGTPRVSISTTASAPPSLSETVTILSPGGGTIEATFTNAWFTEAFDLIRCRSMYYLCSRWHGGSEEMQIKAQTYLMQYLEELNRLRGETATKQNAVSIQRYL